jgi:Sec-independent protein translocase protein TatA
MPEEKPVPPGADTEKLTMPEAEMQAGDDLPDFAKDPAKALKMIQDLRKEAAEYRVKAKEADEARRKRDADEAEAGKAKLREEKKYDELVKQLEAEKAAREAELLALRRRAIASEAGLPAELAARLVGTTDDEIKADAEALKKLLPAAAPTPSGKTTTTAVPGGTPARETDEQRRARIFGGGKSPFG